MRSILVPHDVTVTNSDGSNRPYPFAEMVLVLLAQDSRFNASARGAYAAERIAARVKGAEAGSVVSLESADGELLKQAAAEPTAGYPVRPASFLASFLRAVEAQEETAT